MGEMTRLVAELDAADHQALKAWAAVHGTSISTVIRVLVRGLQDPNSTISRYVTARVS